MKTTTIQFLVFFISFMSSNFAFGLNHNAKANLYDHLFEINENWKFHKGEISNELVSFKSDIERIQTHLLLVEKSLRNGEVSNLNKQQLSNRLKTLNILHQYALDDKFPINTGHAVRQPYFIDIYGTHCAVGFLIKETGFAEISKAISEKQNFAYVKEIVSPELLKWSKDFGFTLDELAWIQPGYPPTQTYSQVGGGTNGTVTCTNTTVSANGRLLIGGEFTELDSLPCLNAGYFENNQLNCYGNGISGKVIGIGQLSSNSVIVGGEFSDNGVTYPIARFVGSTWSFMSIPGRLNAVAKCFYVDYSGNMIVSITAPSISSGEEIWVFSQNVWTKRAAVPGKIYALHSLGFSSHTYAGHFDQIELFENGIGTWMTAKNFVNNNQGNWIGGQTGLPDTIKAVYSIGNSIYLGGISPSGTNDVVLAKQLNGVAQPLLLNSDFYFSQDFPQIMDIKSFNNTNLIIGGSFSLATFTTFGRSLLTYDIVNSGYTPIANLDSTVYSINTVNNDLFIGGAFTKDQYSTVQNKNHLIVLDNLAGIAELNEGLRFNISPNPSTGILNISNINKESLKSIEILDLQGKICYMGETTNLNLTHLKSGTYFVRIETTTGSTSVKKWVKN